MEVETSSPTESPRIQWRQLTSDPNHVLPEAVLWTPVEPSIANDIEQKIDEEAPIEDPANASVAIQALCRVEPRLPMTRPSGEMVAGILKSLEQFRWASVPKG